jgi:hypothetical protein
VVFYDGHLPAFAVNTLLKRALGEPGIVQLTGTALASLAYQAVIVAFASYLRWFWLLTRYLASRLSVFSFATPLYGVAFGHLVLGDPAHPRGHGELCPRPHAPRRPAHRRAVHRRAGGEAAPAPRQSRDRPALVVRLSCAGAARLAWTQPVAPALAPRQMGGTICSPPPTGERHDRTPSIPRPFPSVLQRKIQPFNVRAAHWGPSPASCGR